MCQTQFVELEIQILTPKNLLSFPLSLSFSQKKNAQNGYFVFFLFSFFFSFWLSYSIWSSQARNQIQAIVPTEATAAVLLGP